jgi:hypothetical protein
MPRLFDREVVINAGGLRIASRSLTGTVKPTLRVQFKIVRALKKDPNTGEIIIYNLNKDNRVRLQEKNIPTTVEAGYVDNVSQIFGGVLQFGSNVKQGTDWVTTIQTGDGGDIYKKARINTSLKGPTSMGELLNIAGEALGLKPGNLQEKVRDGSLRAELQEIVGGRVLSGSAEKVFSRIAKAMGYGWSIQNGQIQLLGPRETIDNRATVLKVVDGVTTGLIGSPEPGEKGVVKARALLQPDLVPGRKVQIISKEVNGFFRAEKVIFTGDTWTGDWYSDIEAKPL